MKHFNAVVFSFLFLSLLSLPVLSEVYSDQIIERARTLKGKPISTAKRTVPNSLPSPQKSAAVRQKYVAPQSNLEYKDVYRRPVICYQNGEPFNCRVEWRSASWRVTWLDTAKQRYFNRRGGNYFEELDSSLMPVKSKCVWQLNPGQNLLVKVGAACTDELGSTLKIFALLPLGSY